MQNLEELLRKAEEIRQEVRIGGNTAQRVGLVLVQLVDAAQALLAQIQEEERLRQETDASIKKDINTLDEKVEDLPSPVAPLANNNGLLELKYDTESLYVQDGKLCARLPEADPSEPVPGAGIIYSEGAGISIDDENVISVRIGKSLELDNNGAIRVGTGEGLIHNKEGRLCVNLGDGLGIDEYSNKIILKDNDYIKSLPSLFEEKQDVIEPGNGLEKVGNLLKVEDTLVSDVIKSKQHISSLQVEINQQSIQISSKQDKLSEGLGIIISDNNEISVNGNVLSVMHANNASNDASGRSISGTYATQEEVGSVARSLAGVETRVDANAAAIEELRNNEDIIFGDGLSHVDNVVEVDSNIISGISDNAREIEGIIGDVSDLQSSVSDLSTIRSNAANGATAYGWGYHGTAGYAKKVKVGNTTYEADPSATISLPAYPTSLPANGGNTDTLDGHDSSYFATKTELDDKQDKLTQGSGIEITSENIINVDGSTMHVQLSTNAINDEDGNRIRATYAKKEEVDGIYGAIEATNTTVASHTKSIGSLELNKQDKLEFGNGLSTVGNLVKVEDAVLKNIADNKKNIGTLSSSISGKQDKFAPSDGINLDEGKLSVHIGTGLEFDPLSSAVVVKVGAGVTTDINQSLTIKHDATLTTDADGQLGVNQGTITNIAASEVAKVVANAPANFDTLKEIADYIATDAEGAAQLSNRIGAVESALPNKQDTISDLSTIRSNAANGATAYGWGYHGTAGYAKKAKVNGSTYESDSNGVINLPAYPTTLPANGGNADTLDGKHDGEITAAYFAPKLLTRANTLNDVSDGVWYYINTDNPTDSVGDNSALLQVSARWWDRFQIAFPGNNEGRIYFRASTYTSFDSYFWHPWKSIAFTDSNEDITFANEKGVAGTTVDGTTYKMLYVSNANNLLLGHHTSLAGLNTKINGNNVYLNYGKNHTTGLTLNSSGNVGIGTTQPENKLDVIGDVASRTPQNTAKLISDKDCGIYLKSQGQWLHIAGSGSEMYIYNGEWDNKGNGNYAQGITISTENKIGIGNKSPNYKLDVGGSFNATSGHINGNTILHTGNIGDGFYNVGGTIKISTSYIASSIKGTGLRIDENGLSVDAGGKNGQIASYVSFPDFTTLINLGFLESNYANSGYPTEWYCRALCKWAKKEYNGNGDITLIGSAAPHGSGTCILHLYSSDGEDSSWMPQYASGQFEDLGGNIVTFSSYNYTWSYNRLVNFSDLPTSLPASGGNADTLDGYDSSHFATKNELGNKQDTLAFGSGLNISNSVVQLKLSTGLAIDDRGYIYVTGL
jgi:hypothetical protein